jgi:hypothetical protein
LRRELADKKGNGHFLAAIDGEADFIFAGFRDLEAGNAHNDGRAGRGCAGGDLYRDLLGRRRRLEFLAVGIYDGKFYFFDALLDFLKTKFGDNVTTDGNGELRNNDHVGSAEDIEFALKPGPRRKTKSQNFGRHETESELKRKREKGKIFDLF